MDLDGVVLEAFVEHLREHFRRELLDEQEAVDRASWEPIRRMLQRTRNQPAWCDQQATWQAARQQRYDEADAASAERQHNMQESA
jgi:hypothetical protein